jgi:hypothetical protein
MKLELIKEKLYKDVETALNIKITKNSFISVLLNSISVSLKLVYDYTDYLIKQNFAYSTTDLKYLKLIAPQLDIYEGRQTELYIRVESDEKQVEIKEGYLININGIDMVLREDITIQKTQIPLEDIESFHNENYKSYIKFKRPHYFVNDLSIWIEKASKEDLINKYNITVLDDYTIVIDTNLIDKFDEVIEDLEIYHYSTIGNFTTVDKLELDYNVLYDSTIQDNLTFSIISLVKGANKDDLFSFRERYLNYIRNPQAYFNYQFLKVKAFELFGLILYYELDNENIIFKVIDPFNTMLNYNASVVKLNDLKNYLDLIKPLGVQDIQVINIDRKSFDLELKLIRVNENIINAIKSNINDLVFSSYNDVITLEQIKYSIYQAGGAISTIKLTDNEDREITEIYQKDFIADINIRI